MKKLYLLLTFVILPLQANTFPSLDDLAFSHSNPSTFKETTFDTGMHQIDSGLKAKNVDDLKDGLTKLYAAEPEVTESLFLDGSLLDREALLKSGFSKYELNSLAKAGGLNNTEATKYQTGGLTSSDKFEINVSEFQKGLESGDLNQTTEGLKKAYASGDEEVSAIKDLISSPDSEIHMNLIKTFNQEQLTQIGEAAELEPSEMNALKESRSVFEGSQKITESLDKGGLDVEQIQSGLTQIKGVDPDLAKDLLEPGQLLSSENLKTYFFNSEELHTVAVSAGLSEEDASKYSGIDSNSSGPNESTGPRFLNETGSIESDSSGPKIGEGTGISDLQQKTMIDLKFTNHEYNAIAYTGSEAELSMSDLKARALRLREAYEKIKDVDTDEAKDIKDKIKEEYDDTKNAAEDKDAKSEDFPPIE